jgi:hypothetical protein
VTGDTNAGALVPDEDAAQPVTGNGNADAVVIEFVVVVVTVVPIAAPAVSVLMFLVVVVIIVVSVAAGSADDVVHDKESVISIFFLFHFSLCLRSC